ncbi:polysaccharide lyase [Myxococcus sp. RHSTA-1-4]|uniref:polysaccharide lyase n=1 Tax=Myxococcus sp. RHSTA-1-4 TaxID=2874601 RepID=UPI001CC09AA6|nr:polysaccharide lyase [Myxococcus sp. RHSTA-1-4]MBZ4416299.1 polysaccharide lyase [Myxococcus sp. RHSTA-1-4]
MWLVPFLASAGIVWRGDFETGDRSQYTGTQMVSADRLQVVTSPVAEGKYALKATVRQGDDPINSSGNRNELVYQGREAVGSEYYYRWKVMFPADYPSADTWQLFTQWHHDGCCGSPPVEFYVKGEEIRFSLPGTEEVPWRTKLVRGVWHEFILHAKWSSDPEVGFVELWHNKELVLPKRGAMTMYSGQKNYLKLGLYRNDTVQPVGVVYHDGFVQATTLADVMTPEEEPAPPPVDAGTPPVDAGTPPPVDAGTPPVDAGSPDDGDEGPAEEPVEVDAGTPPPVVVEPEPGPAMPDTGVPPVPGISSDEELSAGVGCTSTGGGPLAAFALLGLLGVVRTLRRRS